MSSGEANKYSRPAIAIWTLFYGLVYCQSSASTIWAYVGVIGWYFAGMLVLGVVIAFSEGNLEQAAIRAGSYLGLSCVIVWSIYVEYDRDSAVSGLVSGRYFLVAISVGSLCDLCNCHSTDGHSLPMWCAQKPA